MVFHPESGQLTLPWVRVFTNLALHSPSGLWGHKPVRYY